MLYCSKGVVITIYADKGGLNMNMTENANMIQFLQSIGWEDAQITNFILCIEGRISIEEASERHKEKK